MNKKSSKKNIEIKAIRQWCSRQIKVIRQERTVLILAGVVIVMIIAVAVIGALNPTAAPIFNLVLLAGLIGVTIMNVYSSRQIAKSSKEQADASAKIAKEAEEQRLMASRPMIIQRAVKDQRGIYFSNFEIYNAGNGPAIELTIAVLTEKKDSNLDTKRETYMRAGVTPISLSLSNLEVIEDSKTYYLVSVYQGVLPGVSEETRYETHLPFKVAKASEEGKCYVTAGKLEFKEVAQKDSIENLISWEKPK